MNSKHSEELNKIKDKLYKADNNIRELRNERYRINEQYTKLLQEECKKEIGRCFKKMKHCKVVSYYKIIDIDKADDQHFNEYQYPALWFKYPYNQSLNPFYEDDLFAGAWGKGNNSFDKMNGIEYEEISNEEFMEKFKEVNDKWVNKMEIVMFNGKIEKLNKEDDIEVNVNIDFSSFIEGNKEMLYKLADENTYKDKDGNVVLAKDDGWREEI